MKKPQNKISILDGWLPPKILAKIGSETGEVVFADNQQDLENSCYNLRRAIFNQDEKEFEYILKENKNTIIYDFTYVLEEGINTLFEPYSFNEKMVKIISNEICEDDYQKSLLLCLVLDIDIKNRKNIVEWLMLNMKDKEHEHNVIFKMLDKGSEEEISLPAFINKLTPWTADLFFKNTLKLKSKKLLKIFLEKYPNRLSKNLSEYLKDDSKWNNHEDYLDKCLFLNEACEIDEFKNDFDKIFKRGVSVECERTVKHNLPFYHNTNSKNIKCHDLVTLMLCYNTPMLYNMVKNKSGREILKNKITPKILFALLQLKTNKRFVEDKTQKQTFNAFLKILTENESLIHAKDENKDNAYVYLYNYLPTKKTIEILAKISTKPFFDNNKYEKSLFNALDDDKKAIISKLDMKENINTKSKTLKVKRKF